MKIAAALLSFALAGGIVYGAASACSFADDSIWSGFLGSSRLEAIVPRNVAILEYLGESPALLDQDGVLVELSQVEGMPWWRPTEPLEPGARVSVGSVEAVVGDVIDDAPPSVPELVSARRIEISAGSGGCGWEDPCGGGAYLSLRFVPSEDDHAASHELAYAVFGGESAEEAGSAALPIKLLAAGADDSLVSSPLVDAWLAIAAVDRAGNMSARSVAVRVER